jgi:hypothetical protein
MSQSATQQRTVFSGSDWYDGKTLDQVCREMDPVGYDVYERWLKCEAVLVLSENDLSLAAQAVYEVEESGRPENSAAIFNAIAEYGKKLARARYYEAKRKERGNV